MDIFSKLFHDPSSANRVSSRNFCLGGSKLKWTR